MELGKPQKVYTIEPLEDPVPIPGPDEPAEPPLERRPEPVEMPLARP